MPGDEDVKIEMHTIPETINPIGFYVVGYKELGGSKLDRRINLAYVSLPRKLEILEDIGNPIVCTVETLLKNFYLKYSGSGEVIVTLTVNDILISTITMDDSDNFKSFGETYLWSNADDIQIRRTGDAGALNLIYEITQYPFTPNT